MKGKYAYFVVLIIQVKMMKVALINILDHGSTGTIMKLLSKSVEEAGGRAYTFSRGWKGNKVKTSNHNYVGNYMTNAMHCVLGKMFGINGLLSISGTLKMIYMIRRKKVELIHLHNLHAYCYNIPILFWFLKKSKIPVVWTFHDCWPMTGYCTYFSMIKCDKWLYRCSRCPQIHETCRFDSSAMMHRIKEKLINRVEKIYIVTPSNWLGNLVQMSNIKYKQCVVINNGIDLSIFKPTLSDLKVYHKCETKKVVLGVAFDWDKRKGVDVFVELAKRLPEEYQIIMIGTSMEVDKILPENIISIHRTSDQNELAKYYTLADVFVNPTREDNFPTTNIEALACGTPVITFDTGGSPEIIDDKCGRIVKCDDIDRLIREIDEICKLDLSESCLKRVQIFSREAMCDNYLQLYKKILDENKVIGEDNYGV